MYKVPSSFMFLSFSFGACRAIQVGASALVGAHLQMGAARLLGKTVLRVGVRLTFHSAPQPFGPKQVPGSGLAQNLQGPVQNERAGPLVQKARKIKVLRYKTFSFF